MALGLSHTYVVLLLVLSLFAARDARASIQGRLLLMMALSVAALELAAGPSSSALSSVVRQSLRLAGTLNLALVWLFCMSLLRDEFRVGRIEAAVSGLLVLGPLLVALGPWSLRVNPILAVYSSTIPFVMTAHVTWVCLAERSVDLVDTRRRARFWIPFLLALAALASVLSEELGDAATASLVRNGVVGIPIAIGFLWWLAAVDPSRLRFEPEVATANARIDPRDQALLERLVALMEDGEAIREPSLTIDQLASRLGTPTHRLRTLINGALGARNFASFANHYRLTHAKTTLADPSRARETILAIAFEAGFPSLQTFNRFFRQAEGITPTQYRRRMLAAHQIGAESARSLRN